MSEDTENREQDTQKKVDEDWKHQVQEEKRRLAEKEKARPRTSAAGTRPGARGPLPTPTFPQFLSGLASQVLISLGEVENPMTGKREVDLAQAQHTIDLLQMLQEKTQGNLTEQEGTFLTNVLHDLRLRYVRAASTAGASQAEDADRGGP